jgi:hypothetical protein
MLRDLGNEIQVGPPTLHGCRDVEHREFVNVPGRIHPNRRNNRTDATPAVESDAFDKTHILPKERRDDPDFEHHQVATKFSSTESPALELFSGWNWTPWMGPSSTAATMPIPSCPWSTPATITRSSSGRSM